MADAGRLVEGHTRMRSGHERTIRRAAQAILLQENDWYSPYAVQAMSARLGQLVDNAARQEGRITQAYLFGLYNEAGLSPNAPRTPIFGSQRLGVSTAEAYARVPAQYRIKVAAGRTHEEALDMAMLRLRNMISTDLQMAHSAAAGRTMRVNRRGVTGYRRIIRPELSRGNVCGLCIAAADRIYSIDTLMPLHNGCNCDVAPMTEKFDPGINLNREDLDALYNAAGSTYGDRLQQVKLNIDDHGEFGPFLIDGNSPKPLDPGGAARRAITSNRSWEARPNFDAMIESASNTLLRLGEEIELGLGDGSTQAALEWNQSHIKRLEQRKIIEG